MSDVPRWRGCAVYGCDKEPTISVRLATDETYFDLELCDDDLVFVREANLGSISGETEL